MERPDPRFARRARRAYELGRLRTKLPLAALAVPFVALSSQACGRLAPALAGGAVLALAVVACALRGEAWGRAVAPGLGIGATGFVLPVSALLSGVCPLGNQPTALVACALGGLVAGVFLAARCLRGRASRAELLATGSLAGLTAAIGCAAAGLGGILGMAAALALSAAPGYALARAR
jgi:hypothetical protein